MGRWALTTTVRTDPADPYTQSIRPLTQPLFERYADRWDIDFVPVWVDDEMVAPFRGRIRTVGTEAVYASLPGRRTLLDSYDGVIYLDQDCVIVDSGVDLRETVTQAQPIAMVEGLGGAFQVLLADEFNKTLLDEVWAEQDRWCGFHWAEEAAFKAKLGWDYIYVHGKKCEFLGATERTPRLNVLPPRYCVHPSEPVIDPITMNPGGCHPIQRRLSIIRFYLEQAR